MVESPKLEILKINATKEKTSVVQTQLPSAIEQPLAANSDRAKDITNVFIAMDPRLYSVVEAIDLNTLYIL